MSKKNEMRTYSVSFEEWTVQAKTNKEAERIVWDRIESGEKPSVMTVEEEEAYQEMLDDELPEEE